MPPKRRYVGSGNITANEQKMTDKSKKFGRNIFDVISEHPKMTFIAFLAFILAIIGVFCFVIYKGNSVKIAGFEVTPEKKVLPDTVIKVERETVLVEKPKIITKYIEPKKETPSTKVQKGDTIIEVKNQPANINTGTNNGIIGNENHVNLNVKEVQRQLDEPTKGQLLELIGEVVRTKNLDKNACVMISSTANNESFNFARQIETFLKSKGYKVGGLIGTFQQSPPIIGAEIGFENKCVSIKVGYKTD